MIDAKTRSNDQVVEPVVRQKFAKIRDHYNELPLEHGRRVCGCLPRVQRRCGLSLRNLPCPAAGKGLTEKSRAFNFPSNFVVYYPQEDSFYSHNERKYIPQHLSEIAPAFLATLPAVVDVGEGAKLAIAESDLEDYPGLWLNGTGGTCAGRPRFRRIR